MSGSGGTVKGEASRALAAIAISMLAAALIVPLMHGLPELPDSDIAAPLNGTRSSMRERPPVFSSMASGPSDITVPGGISALTVVEGDGQVRLGWEAPDSGGQAVVDYYIVYQNGEEVAHCTSTSIVISGLTNGEVYRFMVAAHSSSGIGPLTTVYEATPRAAEHPLSLIAPAATVAAVAVAIVREMRLDLLRRMSHSGQRRERLR